MARGMHGPYKKQTAHMLGHWTEPKAPHGKDGGFFHSHSASPKRRHLGKTVSHKKGPKRVSA